eukprot:TRINITY_DN342_c0_g1_i4.p4 TRINITY_DN342_c0_g1~~TRINITY_DN342_c0_g1_i4.p4  ORF type:complete len:112 (-),score=25.92 TRINITY_DN342_c0_g1_i4:171-506(-)
MCIRDRRRVHGDQKKFKQLVMYQLWKILRRNPLLSEPRYFAGLVMSSLIFVFLYDTFEQRIYNFVDYEEDHPGVEERYRQYLTRKNDEVMNFLKEEQLQMKNRLMAEAKRR